MSADKAVILARGLGTRMREATPGASLTAEQAAAAERGVKALIPIPFCPGDSPREARRPFLDYVLSALADAGWRRACLVVGPEHEALRDYCRRLPARRIHVETAIQERPLGTADAVAAAEAFAGGEPFLCVNSDNYSPPEALRALGEMEGPGLAAFDADALLAGGNIPAERLRRFAAVSLTPEGFLHRLIEKPTEEDLARLRGPRLVSMNCWRLDRTIFDACRAIGPSPRGERELTDAVQYSIDRLEAKFRAVRVAAPVLDLTGRGDVGPVARLLAGVRVEL